MSCGPHQKFYECLKCEKTCTNLKPECTGACKTGCFCDDGYFKAPNDKCVKLNGCPRAEITMGVKEISIEDCSSDEEFLSCGWCEPSCSEPEPLCTQTCTRGCLCRPPLLRHYTGHCVERKNCLPQKCVDSNEEFVCRYGCEARCDGRTCVRPRRCSLGCHCKLGLLRDITGECVTADRCYRSLKFAAIAASNTTSMLTKNNAQSASKL